MFAGELRKQKALFAAADGLAVLTAFAAALRLHDPSDAIEFWDLVNRQDWRICASVQRGMGSRVFEHGYYAPMEDQNLDIRRYLEEKLGSS